MNKKLIDYDGFEAYAKGVKDKYAEKTDIITPSERKYVQLSNDGFELAQSVDIEILLEIYAKTICDEQPKTSRHRFPVMFDELIKLCRDNEFDLNKIINSTLYQQGGFLGVLQQGLTKYPAFMLKSHDGKVLSQEEISNILKQQEGSLIWLHTGLYDELNSNLTMDNTLGKASQKFVKKDGDKKLSTNDYTNEAKQKVDNIPDNPKYTDTVPDLAPYAKKESIPTKVSQLENDKTFKTETEIQSMIEKASSLKKEVVTSLPTTGKDDVIYLVKDSKGKDNNNYLEYLWLNGKYELIGSTQVDLSGYAKLDDIVASKIIDKYVLTKDFRTALNDDQDFLQAIKRDMFTLVIFDGSTRDELEEQAGFESILYYKGQVVGICLIPTGDVISPDFVKQNQFTPNETYITSNLMKDYNQVIQEQFVELQSSLKQYVKNCLNRKLNVADIQEFTQQELEEAFK